VRWRHPSTARLAGRVRRPRRADRPDPTDHRRGPPHGDQLCSSLRRATDVKLAVNVSARSLQESDFVDDLFRILGETGFPADRLELEVTERALVTNAERTRFTIHRLRDAGVRIAIDDFGVGYSSFQTLRLLDVDRVKVDREFVQGLLTHPRDRLIVSSLVRLAHDLGLDVVAEGVESTALWDAVAASGATWRRGTASPYRCRSPTCGAGCRRGRTSIDRVGPNRRVRPSPCSDLQRCRRARPRAPDPRSRRRRRRARPQPRVDGLVPARCPPAPTRQGPQVHRAGGGTAGGGTRHVHVCDPREVLGMAAAGVGSDLLLANETVDPTACAPWPTAACR
jgi:hypothetical protein